MYSPILLNARKNPKNISKNSKSREKLQILEKNIEVIAE